MTEEKKLSQAEIDKQIDALLNKKHDLEMEEAQEKKEPIIIKDLTDKRMKVELKDGKLMDTYCFSTNAIYNIFNTKTKVSTIMNGSQVSTIFGLSDEARKNFALGQFGKSYAIGNLRFTFDHYKLEV